MELQLDALQKTECETIFQKKASGAIKTRPGQGRLLASLRPSDTAYSYELDRLGRSLKHLLDMVAGLRFLGVGLVLLADTISTTPAQGRLVFNLFAARAEFERELIRQRQQRGESGYAPTVRISTRRVSEGAVEIGWPTTATALPRA
ncbi:MAG: recombinase family protein [Bacteroidota bacterium]|nr:recombinase family protein [Bacteroidota bacterium]